MLNSMKETEGVKVLPSGVVVHVLEHGPEGEGNGVRPTRASTVKIHYHGSLPDGTVFDSTLGGDPVQFPLAGVIPGWRDGKFLQRPIFFHIFLKVGYAFCLRMHSPT